MKFVQLVEFQTSRIAELDELEAKWLASTEGRRTTVRQLEDQGPRSSRHLRAHRRVRLLRRRREEQCAVGDGRDRRSDGEARRRARDVPQPRRPRGHRRIGPSEPSSAHWSGWIRGSPITSARSQLTPSRLHRVRRGRSTCTMSPPRCRPTHSADSTRKRPESKRRGSWAQCDERRASPRVRRIARRGARDGLTPDDATWHTMAVADVVRVLDTDTEKGLSAGEVVRRLAVAGPNELVERRPIPAWVKFLRQFANTMIVVLLIAAVVTIVIGDIKDTIVIVGVVVLNAVIGYAQEHRAEQAMTALRRLAAPFARVVRDGAVRSVPARELVPGDVVQLEAGDVIPADARLVDAPNLRVNEAALTGEAVPVDKSVDPVAERRRARGPRRHGVQRHRRHLRPSRGGRHRDRNAQRARPYRRFARSAPGGSNADAAAARTPGPRYRHRRGRGVRARLRRSASRPANPRPGCCSPRSASRSPRSPSRCPRS